VIGAGRTDRGVHARGQVIGFQTEWRHSLTDLQRALNATLASDVAVIELGLAAEGFHPRYSALRRAYSYTVLNQAERSPLERRTAWRVAQKLEVERMAEASQALVGTHDFATFGQPPQGVNTVRSVFLAEWEELGERLTFCIEANAFLYRMVRTVVGTLVQVGQRALEPQDVTRFLEARDRSLIKVVAPAHGLCLVRVDYAVREGVIS
jgi:tRNA pseudouridine38-40 synthase